MKKLESNCDESYDEHYGALEWKDKVVMDVGADYGSTAYWLLEKGAKQIIAIESDNNLFNQMILNIEEDSRIVPINMTISKPEDWEYLINTYPCNVIKSDCEGGEEFLLYINNDILKKVPEYCIEIHNCNAISSFKRKFGRCGYKVSREEILKMGTRMMYAYNPKLTKNDLIITEDVDKLNTKNRVIDVLYEVRPNCWCEYKYIRTK